MEFPPKTAFRSSPEQEQTNKDIMKKIKPFTFTALAALAVTLLCESQVTRADDRGDRGSRSDDSQRGDHDQRVQNRFAILLSGVYKPVNKGDGPKHNLGLNTVDLSDGSYFKVNFFPLIGLLGDKGQDKSIGTFYVQFTGMLCAYDLPGGSISAMFTGTHDVITAYEQSDDGSWTLDGTFELDIMEATGAYQSFVGGHIHMVDILKFRAGDSTQLEDCFCHIHPKLAKP